MRTSNRVIIRIVVMTAAACGTSGLTFAQSSRETPARRLPGRPIASRDGQIDTDLSRVFVFVDKTGFGHQHGVVGRLKSGNLLVANESAGRMVFDLSSFAADTESARRRVGLEGNSSDSEQEQVTANMRGAAVLDVERFPTAEFVLSSVRRFDQKDANGNTQFGLDGDFTLHGTTRRVHITATGSQERGFLHLKGSFPLRQTDFGIRPFKKALGAVGVADVLTVYGDLWVKR
jgi:polyisoprenoid-binding protein YceI